MQNLPDRIRFIQAKCSGPRCASQALWWMQIQRSRPSSHVQLKGKLLSSQATK
jgi:hypothetical protein